MSGDVHVRICEGLGVKFPRATRLFKKKENQYSIVKEQSRVRNGSAFLTLPSPELRTSKNLRKGVYYEQIDKEDAH
jgi:hypothetical protein